MDRDTFFQLVANRPAEDLEKLQLAYWLAKEGHQKQTRDSGERYFEHPRRVALRLIRSGYIATDVLVLALLHDIVEDTQTPLKVIVNLFGAPIWSGLSLLSKNVPNFDPVTGMNIGRAAKDLGDYFAAIADGPREVRLVKIADRLDNLQDVAQFTPERRQKQIAETMRYILPIAAQTCPIFAKELKEICEQHTAPTLAASYLLAAFLFQKSVLQPCYEWTYLD